MAESPSDDDSTRMAQTDTDSDRIEAAVGRRLTARGETLAVAESLTGGLVCSRLTDVPGASAYLDRAVVAYSNRSKGALLAVPREALGADGAVSASVARAMARGIRDTAGTTWGVSTTGIAGPTGGTDTKPVGLVYVGVAYAAPWGTDASFVRTERHVFEGDRETVKTKSATGALSALAAAIDAVDDAKAAGDADAVDDVDAAGEPDGADTADEAEGSDDVSS